MRKNAKRSRRKSRTFFPKWFGQKGIASGFGKSSLCPLSTSTMNHVKTLLLLFWRWPIVPGVCSLSFRRVTTWYTAGWRKSHWSFGSRWSRMTPAGVLVILLPTNVQLPYNGVLLFQSVSPRMSVSLGGARQKWKVSTWKWPKPWKICATTETGVRLIG